LSDDVIEEAFTSTATICPRLFHALRSPLSFPLVLRDSLAEVLENPPELEKIVSTVPGTDRAIARTRLTRCLNREWQNPKRTTTNRSSTCRWGTINETNWNKWPL